MNNKDLKYPGYPILEESELVEIYKSLTDNDEYQDWFVNDNQNMYEELKMYQQLETHYALVGYDSDLEDIVDESTENLFVEVYHYHWDYLKEMDYNIKQWFETDERIKEYENDIIHYVKNRGYFSHCFDGFQPSCDFIMNRFFTHQYRFPHESDNDSSSNDSDTESNEDDS